MKRLKQFIYVFIGLAVISACEENKLDSPQVSTLRVVNAILDVGEVELREFQANFSSRSSTEIRYASTQRYTVATGQDISVDVAPTSDTLDIIFSDVLRFDEAGSINTVVLYGDSNRVESFILEEEFNNYDTPSYGIRFLNLSEDSEPVFPRAISLDSAGVRDTTVYEAIDFREATVFNEVQSGESIENWTFQYLDAEDNILYSTQVPLFFFFSPPDFRNITIPLVGRFDDGQGGSSLTGFTIEHF